MGPGPRDAPVSDTLHGATFFWRVVGEHRRGVYALLAGLIVNVVVFAFLVYPLQRDVANVEQRTRSAEAALAAAQAEHASASGTLSGKDRAVKALDTFDSQVLAADLSGARRLTYARLARLAERSKLEYERGKYDPVVERGSRFSRFNVSMDLTGSYGDIRSFIHEVETAPEFVVIDSLSLAGVEGDDALQLTVELSAYFRSRAP